MQGEVLFLSDLVFAKARAFKYVFDIRNHLRVTTRVRDRVAVIETPSRDASLANSRGKLLIKSA